MENYKIINKIDNNIINISNEPVKEYGDYSTMDINKPLSQLYPLNKEETISTNDSDKVQESLVNNTMPMNMETESLSNNGNHQNTSNDLLLNPDFVAFKNIYKNLVQELTYDREYVKYADTEENVESFSNLINENVRRTIVDKKGVCITFAMRLFFELNKLGIENYLLQQIRPHVIHTLNLYFIDDRPYIADLTDDIVQDHYDCPSLSYKRTMPISYCMNFEEYFKNHNYLYNVLVGTNEKQIDGTYYKEIPIDEFMRDRYVDYQKKEFNSGRKAL